MADKEERYVVVKIPVKDREYECPFYYVSEGIESCNIDESWCKTCKAGMTRSEAIEKIAKGLCQKDLSNNCKECNLNEAKECKRYLETNNYLKTAEAALNALLETKTK